MALAHIERADRAAEVAREKRQDLAAHVRRAEFADQLAHQLGLRIAQPGLLRQALGVRRLFAQHHVVAVGQAHQLPATEERHQARVHQREQKEQPDHPPARAVGLGVALEAQRLLGVHEGRELGAQLIGQAFAAAQPDGGLRIDAVAPRLDHFPREGQPRLLQAGDAVDAFHLLPVVRHLAAQRVGVGLQARQGGLVGLEKTLLAGDQEAAHARFHVDGAALQFAGGARDLVGVLDPAQARQQIQDQRDEGHGADQSAQQRQLEVAAEQAVEFDGVDRGGSFHECICKQNLSSLAEKDHLTCRRRPRYRFV
ncbi:hypothetical protein FQZ97_667290 [compost metagenome]